MRRKSRNHAMRVKIGGQKRGWRSYVKYWRKKGASLKSIGAKWRKACRFHGPAKAKLCPSRKRRRKARNTWKGNRRGHRRAALKGWRKRSRKGRRKSARRGKRKTKFCRTKVRKGSWKSLVRKHGVKKAAKMWKKRKRKCRVK